MALSAELKETMIGPFYGDIIPPVDAPVGVHYDARSAALKMLRWFLSELTYFRRGAVDPVTGVAASIPFHVKIDNIHYEAPESEDSQDIPSIAFIPGDAEFQNAGFGPTTIEDSYNEFGAGTVLVRQFEYNEKFRIEVTGQSKAERRGLIVGIDSAMATTDGAYGIRFKIPDYYNAPCSFTLDGRTIDDNEGSKKRWIVRYRCEMRVTAVSLVNVKRLEMIGPGQPLPASGIIVLAADEENPPGLVVPYEGQ